MKDEHEPDIQNFPRNSVDIHLFLTRRAALELECKGLRHSRGSVYALCKDVYGLKGNRESVLHQMNEIRAQLMEEHKR